MAFSPSGRYLAYSENKNGRYNVIVRDLERRKSKTVHSVGFQLIDQDIDQSLPLLNWANDQTLGIVGYLVAAIMGGWLLVSIIRSRRF